MKAAFLKIPNIVEIREIDDPVPHDSDVLIKVGACGICGHDLQVAMQMAENFQRFGHEFAGEVVEVGPRVARFKPGDSVVVTPSVPCGECRACRNGDPFSCRRMLSSKGGGCAELYCANERFFVPYTGLSFVEGALVEPLTVAIDLVEESNVPFGGEIVVIGAGAIGLMAAKLCKLRGAAKLFIIDHSHNEAKLRLAREWGADVIIEADKEDMIKEVRTESPEGVDRVLITAPPSVLPQAIEMCAFGGTITLIGTDHSGKQNVTLNVNRFHFMNIAIKGAHNCPILRSPVAFDLLHSKIIDADKLITDTFPLADTARAFTDVKRNKARTIKSMILCNA